MKLLRRQCPLRGRLENNRLTYERLSLILELRTLKGDFAALQEKVMSQKLIGFLIHFSNLNDNMNVD